jgi:predicted RNA-binding Zn ribbon-like protein
VLVVGVGTRQPAPGGLALVQQYINTLDLEGNQDELSSPDRLQRWLVERGLLEQDALLDAHDRTTALALRESLRDLLALNRDRTSGSGVIAAFNAVAEPIPLHVRLEPGGRVALEPSGGGVEGALGRLLSAVYTAVVDGTWTRLKVCQAGSCRWAFYDHSKNRSGAWCAMAACGNRSKVRAYQRRRRATAV